jgi:hypothetical protein
MALFPLPPPGRFTGLGIYALYYSGPFPAYAPLVERYHADPDGHPIYIGKVSPTERRAGVRRRSKPSLTPLYDRLRQHANSIKQTSNLDVADFNCRYLVVDYIWIPLVEDRLIGKYKPLWNVLIDGFGIHAPGRRGRGTQMRSAWDEFHEGRAFAADRPAHPVAVQELEAQIAQFFESPEFAEQVTEEALAAEDYGGVV